MDKDSDVSEGDNPSMEIILSDILAENDLLRSQRQKLMELQQDREQISQSLIPACELEAELKEKSEMCRELDMKNRRLIADLHSAQVELLCLNPLRSKIGDLQASLDNERLHRNRANEELRQIQKTLKQMKMEFSVSNAKNREQKEQISLLQAKLIKCEVDRKENVKLLSDTRMAAASLEETLQRRHEEKIKELSDQVTIWKSRCVKLRSAKIANSNRNSENFTTQASAFDLTSSTPSRTASGIALVAPHKGEEECNTSCTSLFFMPTKY